MSEQTSYRMVLTGVQSLPGRHRLQAVEERRAVEVMKQTLAAEFAAKE